MSADPASAGDVAIANQLAGEIAARFNFSDVEITDPRDVEYTGLVPWHGDVATASAGEGTGSSPAPRIAFANIRAAKDWLALAQAFGARHQRSQV